MFCQIINDQAPAEVVQVWPDAIAIAPLQPVADGHRLVLPRTHVETAVTDPVVTATAARRAAQTVRPGEHMALNVGPEAGQTVPHLHIHLWPCLGAGACMPWGCPTTHRKGDSR
ncbi:HIT domain-containing protein [Nocardiopsis sp. HNM0947]|uniref:HIT domain-containing protein n=1 Tax=Nocardiopsis coralli TaxID=2772213 RepID=A0ABR9P4F5_9ACTN|nr:HIT domain-containing protein [Nocardiopsis coralli]